MKHFKKAQTSLVDTAKQQLINSGNSSSAPSTAPQSYTDVSRVNTAKTILSLIKEAISIAKTHGMPENSNQLVVDMVYDYLFMKNNNLPIINIFSILKDPQSQSRSTIQRSTVHPFLANNTGIFAQSCSIDFSDVSEKLKAIHPVNYTV